MDYVLNTTNLLDGKILGVDTPKYESIDIDDIFDFEMVELIYEKYNKNDYTLVTGSCGRLGSAICSHLLNKDMRIWIR